MAFSLQLLNISFTHYFSVRNLHDFSYRKLLLSNFYSLHNFLKLHKIYLFPKTNHLYNYKLGIVYVQVSIRIFNKTKVTSCSLVAFRTSVLLCQAMDVGHAHRNRIFADDFFWSRNILKAYCFGIIRYVRKLWHFTANPANCFITNIQFGFGVRVVISCPNHLISFLKLSIFLKIYLYVHRSLTLVILFSNISVWSPTFTSEVSTKFMLLWSL